MSESHPMRSDINGAMVPLTEAQIDNAWRGAATL